MLAWAAFFRFGFQLFDPFLTRLKTQARPESGRVTNCWLLRSPDKSGIPLSVIRQAKTGECSHTFCRQCALASTSRCGLSGLEWEIPYSVQLRSAAFTARNTGSVVAGIGRATAANCRRKL